MPGGDIYHIIKKSNIDFLDFGEAYISSIFPGHIKAWKMHKSMTVNLVVPFGKVKFVIFDDKNSSDSSLGYSEIILSPHNYKRLTIPPMNWFGFKGLGSEVSLVFNIANIEHDPYEIERREIDEFNYDWEN